MFPILYDGKVTDFTGNNLGRLSDLISCSVSETLNGEYTLELTYPDKGNNYQYIKPRNIIFVRPNHNDEMQAFRIYKVSRSIKDNYKIYANHISYDLSGYQVLPQTLSSLADTVTALTTAGDPFTINTNMTSSTSFTVDIPSSVRSWFGGKEGSLIDVYGGEWRYNNFTCSLLEERGHDYGVRIAYGVNLAEYQRDREDNVYSHVLAYYAKEVNGTLTVVYGDAAPTGLTAIQRTLFLDVTDDYEDSAPSSSTLTTVAEDYVDTNSSTLVSDIQTITVTPELLGTQRVALGDTVHVAYDGEVISTRVVKTVWDALGERYTSIELGTKKTSITETIKSVTASGTSTTKGNNLVTYSITYTSNSYCNSTSVGRIKLYRYGNIGQIYINLKPSTSIPADTEFFEIGSFDCTFVAACNQTLASQLGTGCCLYCNIGSDGGIDIGNYSSTASGTGFYRATIPVIFAD